MARCAERTIERPSALRECSLEARRLPACSGRPCRRRSHMRGRSKVRRGLSSLQEIESVLQYASIRHTLQQILWCFSLTASIGARSFKVLEVVRCDHVCSGFKRGFEVKQIVNASPENSEMSGAS